MSQPAYREHQLIRVQSGMFPARLRRLCRMDAARNDWIIVCPAKLIILLYKYRFTSHGALME